MRISARWELDVGRRDATFEINENGEIDIEAARQFGRSDFDLDLMQALHDDVSEFLRRRFTNEFKRHFDLDLLALFENIKINVHEFAGDGMDLRIVDQRIFVGTGALQGDDGGLACFEPVLSSLRASTLIETAASFGPYKTAGIRPPSRSNSGDSLSPRGLTSRTNMAASIRNNCSFAS